MNVLIVVPWDQERGGVASVVGNLALQLQKRGHQIWFFHPSENDSLRSKITRWNFSGYELNLRPPFIPKYPLKSTAAFVWYLWPTLRQLYSILLENEINIVNIHYPMDYCFWFAVLRRFCNFKMVVSVHGADLLPKGRGGDTCSLPLRFVMISADLLVAPSQSALDEVLKTFPRLFSKGLAIHNGVNISEFEPRKSIASTARKYILCNAVFRHRKAIDVLIKAYKALPHRHQGVELWLVGDGPLRGELETLVCELDLTNQVRFLGFRNSRQEVRQLIHGCSLFVLPSRAETFGIVLLEALASKKPVVATKVGGIPEVIQSGRTGLLVEPENPQALCAAMKTVLDDEELGKRLARAGYEYVKRNCQWETAGSRYEAAFNTLLANPSAPDQC